MWNKDKQPMKRYPKYKDSGIEWIGEIPEGWSTIRLKNMINYQKGKLPSSLHEDNSNGDFIPYLSMDYLRGSEEQTQYVDKNINGILIAGRAHHIGDVLLLWDGSNAGEFIQSKTGVVSSTMARVITKSNMNNRSFFYLSKLIEPILREQTTGMGIPHVNSDVLNNIICPLPPLPEQQTIADCLDRKTHQIDTLIEKKQKLIDLLKEQRTALINQAVTKGLNPSVKMKNLGIEWLGEIPEHWEVRKLKYFSEIVNGSTPKSGIREYWDGDIVWLTPDDLGKLNGKRINDSTRKITEQGLNSCGTTITPPNSIILSTRAPIGHIGISNNPSCTNQGCKTIIPDFELCDFNYVYYLLYGQKEELQSLGHGSTFTELSSQKLKDLKM